MLKMALNQLKEYSSNEWVIEDGKKYNIDTVLSLIKVAEEDFINFKGKMSDSNFKLYDSREFKEKTYSEPIDCVLEVRRDKYYEYYPNHLPRLIKELENEGH
jgi:hypothetical protein